MLNRVLRKAEGDGGFTRKQLLTRALLIFLGFLLLFAFVQVIYEDITTKKGAVAPAQSFSPSPKPKPMESKMPKLTDEEQYLEWWRQKLSWPEESNVAMTTLGWMTCNRIRIRDIGYASLWLAGQYDVSTVDEILDSVTQFLCPDYRQQYLEWSGK